MLRDFGGRVSLPWCPDVHVCQAGNFWYLGLGAARKDNGLGCTDYESLSPPMFTISTVLSPVKRAVPRMSVDIFAPTRDRPRTCHSTSAQNDPSLRRPRPRRPEHRLGINSFVPDIWRGGPSASPGRSNAVGGKPRMDSRLQIVPLRRKQCSSPLDAVASSKGSADKTGSDEADMVGGSLLKREDWRRLDEDGHCVGIDDISASLEVESGGAYGWLSHEELALRTVTACLSIGRGMFSLCSLCGGQFRIVRTRSLAGRAPSLSLMLGEPPEASRCDAILLQAL